MTGTRQQNGDPVVARLQNTGGRAIDLSGHLKLSDRPGGVSAGPFPIQYGTTLAPGQAGQVSTVLANRLPDGPWRVMVQLQSDLTVRRAYATIDFAGARHVAYWADLRRPLILAAILSIVAGLAVFVWRRVRRKRRSPEPASDSPTA